MTPKIRLTRRQFIAASGATALAATTTFPSNARAALMRPIPKSGERIPAVGMGTWITFNVGSNTTLRDQRSEVLRTFLDLGGGMIDSSPMYGSAEDVLGYCFEKLGTTEGVFSATKVWTGSAEEGRSQVADSFRLWRIPKFDLFQVHNLLNWEDHLPMLNDKKAAGDIRYVGVTTSHGSRHRGIMQMMQRDDMDFVQFTYNVIDREAERRLLPMAADQGVAVIINRPFQRGNLIDRFDGKPLPGWAAEYNWTSWAQIMLAYVISHPAVTCAIPATSKVEHMRENMAVMSGPLPDAAMRKRMITDIEARA